MTNQKPLRALSLGAGVQSSTVAMMMKHGEIEPADVAIFADTGAEAQRTYVWVEWLRQHIGIPLVVVQQDDGLTAALTEAIGNPECTRSAQPPLYTDTGAMRERWCTREFKLMPIRKKVSDFGKTSDVVQIIGISADEKRRMGYPDVQYITNEYPLCGFQTVRFGSGKGDVNAHQINTPVMGRRDCIRWMVTHGYPIPPRSACVYCPYRCNEEWVRMREESPEDWAEACRMDELMRTGLPGTKDKCYVHRSLKPLREAPIDHQGPTTQSMFDEDCEGMCGV